MSTLRIEIVDRLDPDGNPDRQCVFSSSGNYTPGCEQPEQFRRFRRLSEQIEELVNDFYTLEFYHAKDQSKLKTLQICNS